MGSCGSKEDENEVQSSFDPKNIYYDINGNLRYGIVLNDVIEEMRRMIVNDSIQDVILRIYPSLISYRVLKLGISSIRPGFLRGYILCIMINMSHLALDHVGMMTY